MTSFILDLDKMVELSSPNNNDIITYVDVEPDFITQLKNTFVKIDEESDLRPDFHLSQICGESWKSMGSDDLIENHVIELSSELQKVQKTNKGLLFHNTDSEILVAHFYENEGWVNDSGSLINGERLDKDSVISMFVLNSKNDDYKNPVVDVEYNTESTKFMEIFGVLSVEALQEIPDREVYLNGNPVYDDRYTMRYYLERQQCVQMLENDSLELSPEEDNFLIEKYTGQESELFEYEFNGGLFGYSRCDSVSRFQREFIQYKHGWLTSSRVYQNLVSGEGQYKEKSDKVELDGEYIEKYKKKSGNGDVIFSKSSDDGNIDDDFSDSIIRNIAGKDQYRLYFASHQPVPKHEELELSSDDNKLCFSNITYDSVKESYDILEILYEQATNEGFDQPRRYKTAAGLLSAVAEISDKTAADSLEKIVSKSNYNSISTFIEQKITSDISRKEFTDSLDSCFNIVNTTKTSVIDLSDSFDYDGFKSLVQLIDEAGQGIELSSGDFADLDEEGYRSVVSLSVDRSIDGNMTREAETGRGPADLRMRNKKGEVVYLGECKYWQEGNKGVKANIETPLQQLDTYDQREKFNSVIVFFDPDSYESMETNDVWPKVSKKLNDFDRTFTEKEKLSERSKIYQVDSDGSIDQYISLHIFDVGVKQHHKSEHSAGETEA